jgi:hypothetical protein
MDSQEPLLKTYKYKPLDDNHIRIVHLQPGEFNDSIFVEISHENLDKASKIEGGYKALSWQWGSNDERKRPIRIKNKGEGEIRTLPVKPNLLDALKRLRKKDRIERLWVDAICINQTEQNEDSVEADKKKKANEDDREKNEEKSNQVSMMTTIFGTAKEVCVWLGEKKDDSDTAVDFIDKLVNLDDTDHISGLERSTFDQAIANDLGPLIKLLKRGWFSRRWVVQVRN